MLKFLLGLTVAVGVLLVLNHMCGNSSEGMENAHHEQEHARHEREHAEHEREHAEHEREHAEAKEKKEHMVAGPAATQAASCFPKDQVMPQELLPHDNSSLWAQVNPQGQGSLQDKNFLQAGHHIGINSVGQTLRNANLQLRSEVPNPRVQVSPFLQSTIQPDVNRRPLEIGGCA
jgi:hypothetical protein